MRRFETMLVREGSGIVKVLNSKDVAAAFNDMRDLDHEEFRVACLSTQSEIIGVHVVSKGTLNSSLVHPREVFKCAILANANSIILLHNHPSGDPMPSSDDISITKKLKKASDVMGIDILDHVIMGEDNHYSMKEAGVI